MKGFSSRCVCRCFIHLGGWAQTWFRTLREQSGCALHPLPAEEAVMDVQACNHSNCRGGSDWQRLQTPSGCFHFHWILALQAPGVFFFSRLSSLLITSRMSWQFLHGWRKVIFIQVSQFCLLWWISQTGAKLLLLFLSVAKLLCRPWDMYVTWSSCRRSVRSTLWVYKLTVID